MLGAAAGQPAGDVPAEPAGASGDEDGAGRLPPAVGARSLTGAHQSPGEDARPADREVVLLHGPGQPVDQPGGGTVVERVGQVDQAAPALGVLQGRDPAETPGHRLERMVQPLAAVDGDGTARGAPDGRVEPDVTERLEQGGGQDQAGGQDAFPGPG